MMVFILPKEKEPTIMLPIVCLTSPEYPHRKKNRKYTHRKSYTCQFVN